MERPETSFEDNSQGRNPVGSNRIDSILEFAAAGLTDKAIAKRLGLTTHAVDYYWRRIRNQFGASSRTEAVAHFVSSRKKPTATKMWSIQSWPGIQADSGADGPSDI